MSDHRTNIFDAADCYSTELSEADHVNYLNKMLEVDHMQDPRDAYRYRTRFVLGLGGPTVEVVVDSRDGVTFFHSFGKAGNRANARDLREIELCGTNAAAWEALADTYRDCFCPFGVTRSRR